MSWAIGVGARASSGGARVCRKQQPRLTRQPFPGRRVGGVDRGVTDGEAVVLDVSQLQALLRKSSTSGSTLIRASRGR